MSAPESIPVVDISGYGIGVGDDVAATFLKDGNADVMAGKITQALENYGAVIITGHGVPNQTLADIYKANTKFSMHSDDEKKMYAFDINIIHGWLFPECEKFKGVVIKYNEAFFSIGHPSDTNHQWPDALAPGFCKLFSRVYDESAELGRRILTLLGLGAGLEDVTYLRDAHFTKPYVSGARVNYYRSLAEKESVDSSAQRLAEHTDTCTATLVYQTDAGGLQVQSPKTGAWLPVPYIPDSVLFQAGDALEYISSGRFPASNHKVVFPEGTDRLKERHSFAFFINAHMDEILKSLDRSKTIVPVPFKHFMSLYLDNYFNKEKETQN